MKNIRLIFENIYAENNITQTRCELVDREDFWWWASENTTGTERNALLIKIQCHINELLMLMKEICHYQGGLQDDFRIEYREEIVMAGRHKKTCECRKCKNKVNKPEEAGMPSSQ